MTAGPGIIDFPCLWGSQEARAAVGNTHNPIQHTHPHTHTHPKTHTHTHSCTHTQRHTHTHTHPKTHTYTQTHTHSAGTAPVGRLSGLFLGRVPTLGCV